LLFSELDLRRTLDSQESAIATAVEAYSADRLTHEPEEQLVAHFTEQFRVDAPVLTEGAISIAAEEAQVDVSGSFDRDTMGQSPFYVPGMRVTYFVPFTGDPNLFRYSPSARTFNPPHADVVNNELQFKYERADSEVAATKPEFDAELSKVRQYLSWLLGDVSMYNASLPARIRAKVSDRRSRLEKAQAGVQALGFPLRQGPRPHPSPAPAKPVRPGGDPEAAIAPKYDVALSFAGENRGYVERVAEILKRAGVSVFYDGFEKATLWGKNLVDHLARIYQHQSRFVVMFISQHYVEKAFPSHERQHAQARALVVKDDYILPARFDDTEVPGLAPTVAYADLRKLSPEEVAGLILEKLGNKR